jgi:hypothetical protein
VTFDEFSHVCPYCGAKDALDSASLCCQVCELPEDIEGEALELWKEFWLFMVALERGDPLT